MGKLEKSRIGGATQAKEQLDKARAELADAERRADGKKPASLSILRFQL